MDATGFYLAADQLLPEGAEPMDRSAVSRIYYGAYHEARAFVGGRSPATSLAAHFDPSTNRWVGSHARLIDVLRGIEPRAAATLEELMERRLLADYEIASSWNVQARAEARSLMRQFRRVLGLA